AVHEEVFDAALGQKGQIGLGDRLDRNRLALHGSPLEGWERARPVRSATSAWIARSFATVSGGRRPNPHSVAMPKSATARSAAATRASVPSTPSVKWTRPRYSLQPGLSASARSGAK